MPLPYLQETLVHRFWQGVKNYPFDPAILIKTDESDHRAVSVASAAAHLGAAGVALALSQEVMPIEQQQSGLAVAAIMVLLRKHGVQPGDRVATLAWNCPELVWVDMAVQSLGGVTVPVYPNATADQVNYVLRDSGAKILFSNEKAQLAKATGVETVLFDDIGRILGLPAAAQGKNFVQEVAYADISLSEELWPGVEAEFQANLERFASAQPQEIQVKSLATIIYTSGSTGKPKGVRLTHGNIASACLALVRHGFRMDRKKDRYLSYLPLAHVYERVNGMSACLWNCVPMAFCRVEEVGEALRFFRPTILLGVPAVWRKIKERIDKELSGAAGLKAKLIAWAFRQKKGVGWLLADLLVFRKIRAQLGGRLRIMLSGGAPISPDVLQFFNDVGLELLQGYGLTETAGGITTNRGLSFKHVAGPRNKVGSVGEIVDSCSICIAPVPGQEDSRDGEIRLMGDLIFDGYWNLPDETAKVMTADGWFCTGDLGYLDADGFLYITGRLKRLLKTDGGKYVAPEKIEKAFESHPIVQYVVPVGDGKPFISGLLFVNQLVAKELLGADAPQGEDAAAKIAAHPAVLAAVAAAVEDVNKKLERWETLKKFAIVPLEASVAEGILTPTLKIRTEEVLRRFPEMSEAFYIR